MLANTVNSSLASRHTRSSYHFTSIRESSQQLHPWACPNFINPLSSAHMVVYVSLLAFFFIQSLVSSAISLLSAPSPPHPGAELHPRLAAEGDLHKVLLPLISGHLFFVFFLLTLFLFWANRSCEYRTPVSKMFCQHSDPPQRVSEVDSL